MLNARFNVLFEDKVLQDLYNFARIKNISVGELIRTAVCEKYFDNAKVIETRRRAIEKTLKIRKQFKGKIDYKALISEGRKI